MKYRRLGKTGLPVSVIGVGTWQFGGEWGKAFEQHEVNAILGRAKDAGINLIDTAECYGDHLSETLIGEYLKTDRREDWVIATKFGHRFINHLDRDQLWSPDDVRRQLEDSLRALGTDYIDLYQFHSGRDEDFDQPELWAMLNEQVAAGKIRHLGTSISGANIYQTRRSSEVNSSAIQVVYNRLEREPEEGVLPECQAQGLGVLARVPLASGFLSGKYKPGDTFTDDSDVRSSRENQKVQAMLREVQAIQRNEVPEGVDMVSWALAWCLQHPAVTTVIPGCKSVEQVDSNARAANLDMVSDVHPQAVAAS